jgi:hypothetical protein
MTARPILVRHRRSYGDDPLPTGQEALDEPFAAFPSWFMRIRCDRCRKDRMLSEAHTPQGDILIRAITCTALRTGYVSVLVFCNSYRHQADADLDAVVESGRADVSLTELRFRCSQCAPTAPTSW